MNQPIHSSIPMAQIDGHVDVEEADVPVLASPFQPRQSWLFRWTDKTTWLLSRLFGIASMIFLLAVTANIPLAQFLGFGYLLEVTGRLARQKPFRSALIGLDKATQIGGVLLGSWLLILPLRLISDFWMDAYIVEAGSPQERLMKAVQIVVMFLTVAHIFAAWLCGGKLRYFFWPIVAPFSFAIWMARRFANVKFFRFVLDWTLGWLSPNVVNDVCTATPIGDWFLPAILWNKFRTQGVGGVYARARDSFCDFVFGLNLFYYFNIGWKGFLGTLLWLLLPTWLLVNSTNQSHEGTVIVLSLFGFLIAVPVFSILPFLQAHFAVDGRLKAFLEVRTVVRNIARAPFAHLVALLLLMIFALPLFLLKIEEIPSELLWTLSLVFIVFTWPARWVVGWAYRCGVNRNTKPIRRWWIRYPVYALLVAVSFSFVFIMFFTRYITWNGAMSLLENHVFLLPAPFWLSMFT